MIDHVALLALDALSLAGLGDPALRALVEGYRAEWGRAIARQLESRLQMLRATVGPEQPAICCVVTDRTVAEIGAGDIDALATAAWNAGRGDDRLIRLLRKIAPRNETLAHLDARAREYGFVQAGSDERLTTTEKTK